MKSNKYNCNMNARQRGAWIKLHTFVRGISAMCEKLFYEKSQRETVVYFGEKTLIKATFK